MGEHGETLPEMPLIRTDLSMEFSLERRLVGR
jgi:hypothetical protein